MANIDCIIDTNPMADEINSVTRHIDGTTAAVVGMKAAVIQAEDAAADHICSNVNKGFYTLIHSQISQKIAGLQSNVDSHLMKLNQQKKQLLALKDRMQRDYGMTSERYWKIFNSLNKNLETRVYDLDRPAIQFAVKEINTISNRTKNLSATVPVSQIESNAVSQRILASNMKFRSLKAIQSMSAFLEQMYEQKRLTDRVMLREGAGELEATYNVPVMLFESCCDKYGNKRIDIALPEAAEGLTEESKSYIRETVNQMEKDLSWKEEVIDENVKNEFNKLMSASKSSDRVKNLAMELFEAGCCKSL